MVYSTPRIFVAPLGQEDYILIAFFTSHPLFTTPIPIVLPLKLVLWASAVHGMNKFFVGSEMIIVGKTIKLQLSNCGLL